MNQFTDIGKDMMIADKYFKLYLRNALQPYDLNAAEGIVMLMMFRQCGEAEHTFSDGKTQDEIIREIHYDKGVMTRTMKELEQKGYVFREQNPSDSRSYIFSLTEKGRDFREPLIEILKQWYSRVFIGIDTDAIAAAGSVLQRMAQNASVFYCEKNPQ